MLQTSRKPSKDRINGVIEGLMYALYVLADVNDATRAKITIKKIIKDFKRDNNAK